MIKTVKYPTGRRDADSVLLKKTVTYFSYTFTKDPMYGTITGKTMQNDPDGLSIKAQVVPLKEGDRLVKQGKLKTGDINLVLRWEYTIETDDTAISPTVVVKEDDELLYNSKRYRVSSLTPIYDEDGVLMWFDAKGVLMDDTGN